MSSNHDDPHAAAHNDPAAGHAGNPDPDPHAGEHEASTPVEAAKRPPLSVLIWPLIILAIVLALVLPNITQAFSRYPASNIAQTFDQHRAGPDPVRRDGRGRRALSHVTRVQHPDQRRRRQWHGKSAGHPGAGRSGHHYCCAPHCRSGAPHRHCRTANRYRQYLRPITISATA